MSDWVFLILTEFCSANKIRLSAICLLNAFKELQGSYASGKCQGNLNFFSRSGNCQGILCCVREK